MKIILLVILVCTLPGAALRADGYPFDDKTQRVSLPSLRLKLSKEQVLEISATGTLTFNEEHLRMLRFFYPKATNRTEVIAATFNDNHEGLSEEDVYCLWVAPDEVAVTLNEKLPKDRSPFAEPDTVFPTDAQLKERASRSIRLGPDGSVFFRGKPITLEQAFALIDDIARHPKPDPNHETAETTRWLYVVVPPPMSERELAQTEVRERRTAGEIYQALVVYGKSQGIGVGREW